MTQTLKKNNHLPKSTMTIDPKYNVEHELAAALDLMYEVFIELWDIRLDLEEERSITDILNPPFDPLKTVGKY